MRFFKRLTFALTYGPELDQLLKEKRETERIHILDEDRHRLKLCYTHRQERSQSHYAEHNCDYCKLQQEKDWFKTAYHNCSESLTMEMNKK